MPKKIDMTGQKIGKFLVLKEDIDNPKKGTYWICQCECGNIKSVRGTSLRAGEIISCGCQQKIAAAKTGKANTKNLLNQKFGKLTVIEQVESKNNRAHWKCQCECGKEVIVSSTNLIEHKVSSCGCIKYSIGEQNIEQCLIENNIKYQKQYCFQDLPKRYFDFAIFNKDNKLIQLIEFDGPQHYDSSYNWYNEEQVKRDNEKNQYCKEKNIKLVRIKYNYRDKINLKILELEE